MGHQFPRAVAAAALTLAVGCGGGGGDADPPPILDNARQQVVADDSGAPTDTAVSVSIPDELPAPDPSTFVGENRIVNLWVGPDGAETTVDLWGRRTFSNGPVLLASGIAFGDASDHVSAPANYELSIVGAGAGPDAPELAGVVKAAEGERITTVFTNADRDGTVTARTIWEAGADQAPDAALDDQAIVQIVAANLGAFDDELVRTLGTDTFLVGDGTGSCRRSRNSPDGVEIRPISWEVIDVTAGMATLSLHPSGATMCDGELIASATIEMTPGAQSVVVIYSRDGETVDLLALTAG